MAGAPIGNHNGLKGRLWAEALKRAISRKAAGCLEHGLDKLADLLVAAAENGDQWAMLEIGNRLDGKAAQAIQFQDDDGSPIGLSVTFGRPLPDDRVSPEARLPLSS